MKYFNYCAGLSMTNAKFNKLFAGPPREPESLLTQKEMDLARSVQEVTEEIMLRTSRHIYDTTREDYLCLAGGVALNCVANGRILREGPFKDIWIQPAAGDAGGALGAALFAWHQIEDQPRTANSVNDSQKGSFLGPEFSNDEIEAFLIESGAPFEKMNDEMLVDKTAQLIADANVIGWFQGRMEFGPRALGNRSIIGDARSPEMQSRMNLKIKYRESFRPFAPSILEERISDYFEIDRKSPYMLLVAEVKKEKQFAMTKEQKQLWGIEKLNVVRSEIPAITHIDYSARIQSVSKETNPLYHKLISCFAEKTGSPVIINTSFNVRGEPIVCTPREAYLCFMRTEIDYLVMGNYILNKSERPSLKEDVNWRQQYELD